MIFQGWSRQDGCVCLKCGPSIYEGISTHIQRKDGQYDLLTICSRCLFTGGISEEMFEQARGFTSPPKPMPVPEPIKPRWFSK